ncbi:MAG: hypothetical protein U5N26_06500 [Candidatus Marinimicrobia bacterium]|nr:hypothetical protein [Candidatus Neomarinimicrobiota bacterium]
MIFLFVFPLLLLAQIQNNFLLERNFLIQKYNWERMHTRKVSDILIKEAFEDTSNFIRPGVQADIFWQNASIEPSWNYNDKLNYTVVPVIYGRASKDLTFYVSFMAQNGKYDIIDSRKSYLGETQAGHRGDFEISKIQYETEHFYLKFGRDYFLPGMYFHESMLFSRYQYSYDQIHLAYWNKWLEVSSYYLRLNDMHSGGDRYLRNLNGHRVSVNLFDHGYIALNEYILYQGVQRPMNLALFNPFLIYYLYQRNENIGGTNSMMSLDFFYHVGQFFLHGEFIMDDFMTEKHTYSDLEPNKFGFNTTVGIKNIVPDLHWNVNYTRIANRVYATGNSSGGGFIEYLVHENLPIGHHMGSNLWEIKSSVSYLQKKYQGELQFIYRQYGDDVVYSPYNTDHYQGHESNDPLEPGAEWNEAFPYVSDGGEPSVFWGFKTDHYYQLMDYFGLNLKASYWIEKGLLSSHFNIAGGVYFNF